MICFLKIDHVQYPEVGLLSEIHSYLLYNNLARVNKKFKGHGLY